MKRRLPKLIVFLLLGALVNVAVAWGLAAWGGLGTSMTLTHGGTLVRLTGSEPESFAMVDGYVWPGASRIIWDWNVEPAKWAKPPEEVLPSWGQAPRPDGPRGFFGYLPSTHLDARGWPMLCLWSRFEALFEPPMKLSRESHGVRIPPFKLPNACPFKHARQLPLAPIWPGFAINTIFYAAILWCLTLGQFTARRMIRHRRGHCINCSYDLRGTSRGVCPECGAGCDGV